MSASQALRAQTSECRVEELWLVPEPHMYVSYKLNLGTSRGLYRVWGGTYEGIYYKFSPGLV